MLYENYYKKVSIIARILNQIRRFRKWLIGLLIAVIVAFCIFMVLQGTIYGDKLEADEVVYGENVSFEARALFRDVSYEFSEDSEFSKILTETPKMPGEYSIRAVSKSFFGKPKYGKAHKFTIVPREINVMVAEQQIIYGDLPNVKAELVYDDKITCDGYSYEDITLKQTKVIPKSEAIRIFDENNKDVTYAYIVKPVQTDIGFTPRDITITIDDVSREYNGQPFLPIFALSRLPMEPWQIGVSLGRIWRLLHTVNFRCWI